MRTSPATSPGVFCLRELLFSCCKWPKGFIRGAGLAFLVLAAPHKRIHSPLSWVPRHKPSKWKGQRDGGTCSSPERVTASGGAGAISQLLRTTSAVSTERKSFGIEIGKGELVPCSTGHSMMLRALDSVRRAASQMQPLLNLPAWALERHYTRCRPPRLYPKSFTAKTPTLHPGLGARTWPQSSSLPTKSCFRTWERGHWRCHIPKCVSALLLLLQLRNCDFEPGKES